MFEFVCGQGRYIRNNSKFKLTLRPIETRLYIYEWEVFLGRFFECIAECAGSIIHAEFEVCPRQLRPAAVAMPLINSRWSAN